MCGEEISRGVSPEQYDPQPTEIFLKISAFYLFLFVGPASREDIVSRSHSFAEPLCAHDIPSVGFFVYVSWPVATGSSVLTSFPQ